ncbi:Protein kinase domain-containing protein ppk32 [Cryptotrichosporon argae]
MLAVASNFASAFGKSSSLSAYALNSAPSPASSSSNLAATASASSGARAFNVGLWKVVGATHKTTGKDVSVWIFEKRVLDAVRAGSGNGREWVVEQLKKEATSLSRLRHPDILHMVEPLEDSRAELTFVTETITASLGTLLSAAAGPSRQNGRPPAGETSGEIDLDEVEIQKGTLQIAKGLAFLHQQAKMVHLNISPDAILINAKGDWKLSGLSLTTPLHQPDGSATRYVYPEVDARLPPQVQWKLDYLAPEYALDSSMTPAADLYALGCVLYAVHMGGRPPFSNRGSMGTLRDNAEGPLVRREYARGSRWERCSSELKDLLPRLLTRTPSTRISLPSLPTHPFFSSLAISTLNFLDPTTFASKPREEKATFLRGLVRVLPTFSERLKKGKILLSLLEEMKDPYLLPFILPNVFEISKTLSKEEFTLVLPKLQPLFILKDPPQNMLTLLEHLSLFEEKTLPSIFRENVMPLIYNSLESEHLPVQEKVLKAVPHLCEILDYGTVQNVLLVKVAILFTRTRILSVKVQTLECFKAMVATLDTVTLTTKLVPLLAKIKTKEPAVMMATLAVQEAMGLKVGREAIATLVLPQLWAMSMGPLLNTDQFSRFMAVIKALGARVEREHGQHLREVRKMEETTASPFGAKGGDGAGYAYDSAAGGEVDFEALVKGGAGAGFGAAPFESASASASTSAVSLDPWGDDGWAADDDAGLSSAFASTLSTTSTPPLASPARPSPRPGSSKLKARPIPSTKFDTAAFAAPLSPAPAPAPARAPAPAGPNYNLALPSQQPKPSLVPPLQPTRQESYAAPMPAPAMQPMRPMQPSRQAAPTFAPLQPNGAAPPTQVKPPPGWAPGLMQPSKPVSPAWGGSGSARGGGGGDWGDFDPLK